MILRSVTYDLSPVRQRSFESPGFAEPQAGCGTDHQLGGSKRFTRGRFLIGRIAPTRTEGINLRGIFRFPVERYADKILPSAAAEKRWRGLMNSENRAGISLFRRDQNTPHNQPLVRRSVGLLGKYALPLPCVIARKMRGPLLRRLLDFLRPQQGQLDVS